ncbi:hypothetical protein EDD85DRAFT_431295 [Armillaria nabsnona]|nr:hypothetical protein EDD85DRAFT_431295 [Armillaria nabsnona]
MSATMIPPSTSPVVVKALNVGQLKCLPASLFFTPVVEGHEFFSGPVYASRQRDDLVLRENSESLSPVVHGYIGSLGGLNVRETVEASTDVPEKLTKGDVDLGSVKAVIWK